jgi:hypothetical protein
MTVGAAGPQGQTLYFGSRQLGQKRLSRTILHFALYNEISRSSIL